MDSGADIDRLAHELAAAGYVVTIGLEVEASGAAAALGLSPKTLRNMRSELRGPSWRLVRGIAWYRLTDIFDLMRSRDACVLGSTASQSARSGT
jgi:hypothetical protein